MSIKCTCYYPLIGIRDSSIKTKTGKDKVHILSQLEVMRRFHQPYEEVLKRSDIIPIPCGKCIGCRLAKSKEWANRCMLEASYHSQNWFVTLTYDDNHLPLFQPEGIYRHYPMIGNLVKKDLQEFIKRLRINYERTYPGKPKIKFFACGEYGEKKSRPHYHVIFFGLDLPDLKLLPEKTKSNKLQYKSDFLSRAWSVPAVEGEKVDFINGKGIPMKHIGLVRICECNWNTCAYVARYTMKKQTFGGDDSEFVFKELGLQRPFVTMSNGIGRQYYEEKLFDIYAFDEINISLPEGGKSFKPPRYFDNLMEKEFPDDIESIRAQREYASRLQFNELVNSLDVPYVDYLQSGLYSAGNIAKSLVRDLD